MYMYNKETRLLAADLVMEVTAVYEAAKAAKIKAVTNDQPEEKFATTANKCALAYAAKVGAEAVLHILMNETAYAPMKFSSAASTLIPPSDFEFED